MKARHEGFTSDREYGEYLKKYYAAMAMQGILSNHWCCKEKHKSLFSSRGSIDALNFETVAQQATQYADALLTELEKH